MSTEGVEKKHWQSLYYCEESINEIRNKTLRVLRGLKVASERQNLHDGCSAELDADSVRMKLVTFAGDAEFTLEWRFNEYEDTGTTLDGILLLTAQHPLERDKKINVFEIYIPLHHQPYIIINGERVKPFSVSDSEGQYFQFYACALYKLIDGKYRAMQTTG